MRTRPESQAFPCPFCRSGAVLLIGGNRVCLYYRCEACSEVWTATPARDNPASLDPVPAASSTVH